MMVEGGKQPPVQGHIVASAGEIIKHIHDINFTILFWFLLWTKYIRNSHLGGAIFNDLMIGDTYPKLLETVFFFFFFDILLTKWKFWLKGFFSFKKASKRWPLRPEVEDNDFFNFFLWVFFSTKIWDGRMILRSI